MLLTDRHTDGQTDTVENITSLTAVIMILIAVYAATFGSASSLSACSNQRQIMKGGRTAGGVVGQTGITAAVAGCCRRWGTDAIIRCR